MTKTVVSAVGIVLLTAAATGIALKLFSSPIKDSYFDEDTDKLRRLPANLAVVRPTHFPRGSAKLLVIRGEGESVTRALGRDVLLQDVIGTAWDCNPSRVVLPPDAPKGGFDFLVTAGGDARGMLQKAVREELGYVARQESRETQVWVLKVVNPRLPGLTVSSDHEKTGAMVKEGKVYFQHQPLSVIFGGLSRGLKQPVVDQTGLNQSYNFSVPWTPEIQQRMQTGTFDPEGVKKVLASLGLGLELSTQPLDMWVVEKAR